MTPTDVLWRVDEIDADGDCYNVELCESEVDAVSCAEAILRRGKASAVVVERVVDDGRVRKHELVHAWGSEDALEAGWWIVRGGW